MQDKNFNNIASYSSDDNCTIVHLLHENMQYGDPKELKVYKDLLKRYQSEDEGGVLHTVDNILRFEEYLLKSNLQRQEKFEAEIFNLYDTECTRLLTQKQKLRTISDTLVVSIMFLLAILVWLIFKYCKMRRSYNKKFKIYNDVQQDKKKKKMTTLIV